MLEGGNAGAEGVLHVGVGGANVLVVGGGAAGDVGLGVAADAGGAEAEVALVWVGEGVPLQQ